MRCRQPLGSIICLVSCSLLWAACRPTAPENAPPDQLKPDDWFVDVTADAGVGFVHEAGERGRFFMPEQMGSGVALFDYDQDGRLDLYLIHFSRGTNGPRNRLYHQERTGRFRDVSEGSGLDITGPGMGVAAADANNDGRPDLLVTEYGGIRLFFNEGGGRFREVTRASGLSNPRWATSAVWVDYDRDGWLDLVVANYLDYDPTQACHDHLGAREYCGPHGFPGLVTRLFRNRAQGSHAIPSFVDVTVASGLARKPGPALGVYARDFNGDHWPDLFLADDGRPNRLWVNQGDGTFVEEAALRGLAYDAMGQTAGDMGIAAGDADGDGLFDLFVTHLKEEQHAFWKQGPPGLFRDQFVSSGLQHQSRRGTGFGAALADFNRDGHPDLVFVNGAVKRIHPPDPEVFEPLNDHWRGYAQRTQLFQGIGKGQFREVSHTNPALCGRALVGRGLACGDLDNDGALDLVITGTGGPARVFRNRGDWPGHWLLVRAVDPGLGGRDVLGTEVRVRAGGRQWTGFIDAGGSYLSSQDPRAHIGLGTVDTIETVELRWPDGVRERFPGGGVDRLLLLSRGDGVVVED